MSDYTIDTAAAQAAGVQLEEEVFVDYWGFEEKQKHYLPDGKQFFLIQRMNEGGKSQYQKATRSDVTVMRNTGDAKLKSDPAQERHALLEACVVGWYMLAPNQATGKLEEVQFSLSSGKYNFQSWLKVADPRLVEDLEKACRKLNPWLLSDMTVEDIDKQIEELKEMREEVEKRERGE